MLILGLITLVVPSIAMAIAALLMVGEQFGTTDAPMPLPFTIANWVLGVAFGVISAVAPVVQYFSLRCEKDGLDVEQLANLVDEIGAAPPAR